MNKLIRNYINELYRLNKFVDYKALSKEEIQEEEEHFKILIRAKNKIKELLDELHNYPFDDEEIFSDYLLELYYSTCKLNWYFDNLNKNIEKIIEKYSFNQKIIKNRFNKKIES